MKHMRFFILGLLLCGGTAARSTAGDRPVVAVTTTLLGGIVAAVAGDALQVVTICPGALCPGHVDVGVREVRALDQACCVFQHGFENFLPELLRGSSGRVYSMDTNDNGMLPPVHRQWVMRIAVVLGEVFPEQRAFFARRGRAYCRRIESHEKRLRRTAAACRGVRVICALQQAGFARYLGMEVKATYPRPDEFTPVLMAELVEQARAQGVRLVIDNIQSGQGAGIFLLREVEGLRQVDCTNFPDTSTAKAYLRALERNIEAVCEAVQ